MNFSNVTEDRINLVNEVLDGLSVSNLFKNPNFEIDSDSLRSRYVKFATVSEHKKIISLFISIEYDSISIDICGLSETFEWSKEDIENDREKIKSFFKQLFVSYILLESCGSPYAKSRMYLFDNDGNLTEKYILRGVLHKFSGWDCDKTLFFPIFQKS